MVKRLSLGLAKGVLVGGAIAALLIYGFGLSAFGTGLAYLTAVLVGVLTGLIAGKPIWAKDARIEAGLKAFVGSLVAAAAMFGLRKWVGINLDLGAFGVGTVGELPIVSLPIIATVLALFYEIDNSGADKAAKDSAPEKKRVDAPPDSLSEALQDHADEEPAEREARHKH